MKKLVIFSQETVFGGIIKTILAEMADCLAASVSSNYNVYVICPLGRQSFGEKLGAMRGQKNPTTLKFFKINYVFYPEDNIYWAVKFIDDINPDILHVFGRGDLVEKIASTPKRKIYTFDNIDTYNHNLKFLSHYDVVTCPSQKIIETLNNPEVVFTPCGLLLELFQPSRGLLLTKSYNVFEQGGREKCRNSLAALHGIPKDKIIFLASDIRENVDFSEIIKLIPTIDSVNGFLLIPAKITTQNENLLAEYKDFKNYKYIGKTSSLIQIPSFKSGADFCIVSNDPKTGSFTPLGAAHYGCVPILSLDNPNLNGDFTEGNSIVVKENDFSAAIIEASKLFKDQEAMAQKRTAGMALEKDWQNKKKKIMEIYEN